MKMNKLLIAAGVVCGFAGISGTALAQATDVQDVTATILAPTEIAITRTVDMTFEDTIALGAEQNIDGADAVYTVEGDDRSFSIDTTGSSANLAIAESFPGAGDGSTMPFTVTAEADSGLLADGTAEISVAGAITVAADQAAGTYEGVLSVTVAYE